MKCREESFGNVKEHYTLGSVDVSHTYIISGNLLTEHIHI